MRGRVQLVGFWERRDDEIFRGFWGDICRKVRVIHLVTHHQCVAHHSRPYKIYVIP